VRAHRDVRLYTTVSVPGYRLARFQTSLQAAQRK